MLLSVVVHLHNTARPHIAVTGNVPGTEHFRNVLRHDVTTHPGLLSYLSEVKGPIMDKLERTDLLKHLTGQGFLSQHLAIVRAD